MHKLTFNCQQFLQLVNSHTLSPLKANHVLKGQQGKQWFLPSVQRSCPHWKSEDKHNVESGSFPYVVKIVISSLTQEGRDFSLDARSIWEHEYPCGQWDLGI